MITVRVSLVVHFKSEDKKVYLLTAYVIYYKYNLKLVVSFSSLTSYSVLLWQGLLKRSQRL